MVNHPQYHHHLYHPPCQCHLSAILIVHVLPHLWTLSVVQMESCTCLHVWLDARILQVEKINFLSKTIILMFQVIITSPAAVVSETRVQQSDNSVTMSVECSYPSSSSPSSSSSSPSGSPCPPLWPRWGVSGSRRGPWLWVCRTSSSDCSEQYLDLSCLVTTLTTPVLCGTRAAVSLIIRKNNSMFFG